ERAVADAPARVGGGDEGGRDDELPLVDQVVGQELGGDGAAALDHQPLDAAGCQVGAEAAHLDAVAAVDHGRDLSQPGAGVADAWARTVDELLGLDRGEEVGGRVEVRAPAHR